MATFSDLSESHGFLEIANSVTLFKLDRSLDPCSKRFNDAKKCWAAPGWDDRSEPRCAMLVGVSTSRYIIYIIYIYDMISMIKQANLRNRSKTTHVLC